MSDLLATLERIRQRLEAHELPVLKALQPGLTAEEIAARTGHLPFRLPREVVRLYQWRNGTDLSSGLSLGERALFNGVKHFLSLEDALGIHREIPNLAADYEDAYPPELTETLRGAALFPLFADGAGGFHYVACAGQARETGVIVDDFGAGEEPRLAYRSLTEMLEQLAELYEAGNPEPYLFSD